MIYISYFTQGTVYEEVMNELLLPSLKKWKLKYDIQGIKNKGSWSLNTAMKSKFIIDMLNKHNDDVIFLDADATIEQKPILFNNISKKFDIACHYLDWGTWYKKTNKKELLSGTILLRNNNKVKKLCKEWHENAINNSRWEQLILADILKERKDIKVYELPLSYCYIKSLPNGKDPFVKLNPVILHHQVGRKYKRNIQL